MRIPAFRSVSLFDAVSDALGCSQSQNPMVRPMPASNNTTERTVVYQFETDEFLYRQMVFQDIS